MEIDPYLVVHAVAVGRDRAEREPGTVDLEWRGVGTLDVEHRRPLVAPPVGFDRHELELVGAVWQDGSVVAARDRPVEDELVLLTWLARGTRSQRPLPAEAAQQRRDVSWPTQPVRDRDRLGKPPAARPGDVAGGGELRDRAALVAADQRERGRRGEQAAAAEKHQPRIAKSPNQLPIARVLADT